MALEDGARSDAWSRLMALMDPVRRRLYDYVAAHDAPVRRDEAAAFVGISRTLAAYHLDRLAEAGLLAASYARPAGQTGPGAGRPAKRYEQTLDEVSITVPPRTYELLARLLVDAVAADPAGKAASAVMEAAEQEGRNAGVDEPDLMSALRARAYEPALAGTGDIVLRNCPFHQMAQRQTELVCGLNLALLRGTLASCGCDAGRAELVPHPRRCCVVIHSAKE